MTRKIVSAYGSTHQTMSCHLQMFLSHSFDNNVVFAFGINYRGAFEFYVEAILYRYTIKSENLKMAF